MKRAFILLTLLILTSNISIYAQTEEEIKLPDVFPTEDAVWVISVTETYNNPRDPFDPYYKETTHKDSYYLLGDTIIENKKYSKLYSIYGELDSLKVKSCNFYTENQLYVGAIRVEGEQVYLRAHEVIYHADGGICHHIFGIDNNGYPYYNEEEIDYSFFEKDILMYDFSVEESERLYIVNYPDICRHFLAYGITDDYKNAHTWIKGIGSTGGLWFNYDFVPMSGSGIIRNLKSFYYKGKQFYPAEGLGINESVAEVSNPKAYVSNGVLYIENVEDINSVEIYDTTGRVITSGSYNSSSVQIQLPATIKGVIMVKVNSKVMKVIAN